MTMIKNIKNLKKAKTGLLIGAIACFCIIGVIEIAQTHAGRSK